MQQIVGSFWRSWRKNYLPSLIVRQKWHTDHRNVSVGDVVLIGDKNEIRGAWKLAMVSEVFPSSDGKVRRVSLQYKNIPESEDATKYSAHKFVTVQRPVQRVIVICPAEDQ